jgi:hypothetical protein
VDLLLVRRGADGEPLAGFHESGPGEAMMLARNLSRSLGTAAVKVVPAEAEQFWVRAEVGAFVLIVCGRVAGQPYRPLALMPDAARQMADAVRAVLCPAPDAERELYVNTHQFAR